MILYLQPLLWFPLDVHSRSKVVRERWPVIKSATIFIPVVVDIPVGTTSMALMDILSG